MTEKQRPQTGHGPPIGSINVLEATIGQRGMGKSTYQCWRAWELLREHKGQGYVIGHSLGARLPSVLPREMGGATLPIMYHRTVPELDRALRSHPTKWHILAPPLEIDKEQAQSSCDDLIAYAIRLSESLRDRAYERAHPIRSVTESKRARRYDGIPCPFIAIVVDEGIAIESAASGQVKDKVGRKKRDWFLQWIYSLRHYHTALFYAIQNATARNWNLLSEATRVVVFRVRHQWALNAIQAAGGTPLEMRAAKRLEPHQFIALGEDPRLADDDEDLDVEGDNADEEPIDDAHSDTVQ